MPEPGPKTSEFKLSALLIAALLIVLVIALYRHAHVLAEVAVAGKVVIGVGYTLSRTLAKWRETRFFPSSDWLGQNVPDRRVRTGPASIGGGFDTAKASAAA